MRPAHTDCGLCNKPCLCMCNRPHPHPQVGQLQAYEQLPAAATASSYPGLTPQDLWAVPDSLPQAPYRFRPSQPSGSSQQSSPSSLSVAASKAHGAQQHHHHANAPRAAANASAGRNTGSGSGSASAGSGASTASGLQTWPVLVCASSPGAGAAASASAVRGPYATAGQLPGRAAACAGGMVPDASHGHGSVRLLANWGAAEAPSCSSSSSGNAGDGGGGGGAGGLYGYAYSGAAAEAGPAPLEQEGGKVTATVELLPSTLWLSLPLLQRLAAWVEPLAAATAPGGSGHSHNHGPDAAWKGAQVNDAG